MFLVENKRNLKAEKHFLWTESITNSKKNHFLPFWREFLQTSFASKASFPCQRNGCLDRHWCPENHETFISFHWWLKITVISCIIFMFYKNVLTLTTEIFIILFINIIMMTRNIAELYICFIIAQINIL